MLVNLPCGRPPTSIKKNDHKKAVDENHHETVRELASNLGVSRMLVYDVDRNNEGNNASFPIPAPVSCVTTQNYVK